MKLFKKMLILNWHYISREVIELEGINFLTGKNASGKSTVIDAMQLLLLGDATGTYFNKAANDKSKRTLIGYAKGELSDSDTSFNYLRSGRFTTHLALEVYDDVKHQSFVIGFVMDIEGDDSSDKKYYWMEGALPEHDYVRDNRAMGLEEIKAEWKRSGTRHNVYGTQMDYRDDFKVKMGHLNDKYFELFKKAVAFKPDVDLKRFITEFICETENEVNIDHMRDNIRHYERLKQEAEDIAAMVEHLEGIAAIHSEFTKEQQNETLYGFLIRKGELEALRQELERYHKRLESLEDKARKDATDLAVLKKKVETCQLDINVKNGQLAEFEPYRIEQDCKSNIIKLKETNADIDSDVAKELKRVGTLCRRWLSALELIPVHEMEGADALKVALRFALEDFEAKEFLQDIGRLQTGTEEMKLRVDSAAEELETEHRRIETEIREAEAIRSQLNAGNKPYEESVRRLKSLLEEQLSAQQGAPVAVDVFCELIEITDEHWKNAIEGYLHTQKFNLIVVPEHFEAAIRLFEQNKHALGLYGVGLVDVGRIMEKSPNREGGSLAEEIRAENDYARAYADYLLGKVMKCEDVLQLRRHRVAITDSCMLYKNFVATQIHPGRYEFPYIGRGAVKRQLEMYEQKLKQFYEQRTEHNRQLEPLQRFKDILPLSDEAAVDYEDARIKQGKLLKNEELIRSLQKTLANLDMSTVLRFKEELAWLVKEQDERITRVSTLKVAIDNAEKTRGTIRNETLPDLEVKVAGKQELLGKDFTADYQSNFGVPRYQQEFHRLQSHDKIRDNFDQSFKTAQNRKEEYFKKLIDARGRFETLYRRDLGLTAVGNDKYDRLLKTLQETELPSFMEKIDEAIRKAQQEFKDDFISKLKSNIDTVNRQIDALNASLKTIRFGKDQYKFMVKPNDHNRKYYDMIMDDMLMNGFNLFSSDFQTRHKDALDELFKKIVDVGEGALSNFERAELDKNVDTYTDYRTYLDFDLIVTDENGEKSHLSKMLNKKSGGETQTPFFISVLASFHRLYSLGDKRREDTIRLIIFDEAFSKMDHERIEESLKLLRDMRFQALISAPTEKIANIAPFADKTLCVLRSKRVTQVREWDNLQWEG